MTFLGRFHPNAKNLFLTDIAHHHLIFAILCIIRGHIYRTKFDIGHSLHAILNFHISPLGRLGFGHQYLYFTVNNSLHFQLSLALASIRRLSSLVAQHIYALPSYAFLFSDYTTQSTLYTHHQYIAGFSIIGAFSHSSIFFVRDYNSKSN